MRRLILVVALCAVGCGASPSAPTPAVPAPSLPTDPRFDLTFYRQLTQNAHDGPPARLQRLTSSPRIYLQRTGLSDGFVAQLEQTARELIPAFTGGALSLAGWEAGTETRADANGWIMVTLRNDDAANCGNANVGLAAGHIWLNTKPNCARRGEIVGTAAMFAHELGHALGFWHTGEGLMQSPAVSLDQQITDRERYHGAYAYTQPNGSLY